MFESLSDRLGGIFDKLTGRGALSEADVDAAMREIRRALLEADVALEVVRAFTAKVREKAIGARVVKSVTPGQMVVKIVHDQLVEMLGEEGVPIDVAAAPPVAVMMVGLQGSGKTTTTAKVAKRIAEREKRRVLMASLDTQRPAAQEQLRVLGEQTGIETLKIVPGQTPTQIAERAMTAGRLGGFDVVLLDTAGRLHIDEALMRQIAEIERLTRPREVLLVADALTGQDAVNVARSFSERVGVTGIVLTRVDGDGRGGAALSMRAVTGKPIKLIGVGERVEQIEEFHPRRIADRILGMGDIVSLVEKASETVDAAQAAKMAQKLKKGGFDLEDLRDQLKQMEKLGGLSGLMGMMPGVGKMKKQMTAANLDDGMIRRQVAIIDSMTPAERKKPEVMKASRKKRVAAGSGTRVEEVNRLLKMHRQMSDMMKAIGRKKGGLLGGLMGGGGMPDVDPAELERMARTMKSGGALPGGLPPGLAGSGASGPMPGLPGGMPMGGLPGLGGKVKFGRKK